MTKEEILAHAIEHYILGKSFISVFDQGNPIREIQLYEGQDHIYWRWSESGKYIEAYNGIKTPPRTGWRASAIIYENGQWAPLIENEYNIF